MNKIKQIKPLVIGIGVAGRRHLEAQLNLGFKTGVYTTNPQTAKSLRTNLKDALFLQDLAQRQGVEIFVGQNYRLTPTFAEIRKRVLSGQLGVISQIESTYFHDRNDYQNRYHDKNFLYTGGY